MKYRYIIISLLYMAVIWFFSSRPGDAVHIPGGLDKAVHFIEYGVLGFLIGRGLGRPYLWAAVLVAAGWGILDEWHQSWVPLRNASLWDAVADGLGSCAGAAAAGMRPRARN